MNTPTPPNANASNAPNASNEAPLAIAVQYVKDFSFENPNAPQSLSEMGQNPNISVDMNVDARQLGERRYEVVLRMGAKAEREGRTIFEVELQYGGVCQVGSAVPQEQISPLVMIEGPRMLFPFARGIIANATRDGGFPPLLLNPVNFVALYQQMAAQQAASQDAQNPAATRNENGGDDA